MSSADAPPEPPGGITADGLPGRAEASLAGTLCLMSCFVQHPLAVFANRIAANLASLGGDPTLTPELRAVCRKLASRWGSIGAEAESRAAATGMPPDERSVH